MTVPSPPGVRISPPFRRCRRLGLRRQAGRSGSLLVAAAVLVVLAAGCGGGGGRQSIVLYNGQHLQLTQALVSAFEKQTGISVEMRTSDSLVLASLLLEEGHASPADVYISENSPELQVLSEHGLLARLPPAILEQVPAADSSPTGEWVGMALRVSSLVYDPTLLPASKLPRSILDLAEPAWKGKIAIAPTDSDFPPVVGAVLSAYGVKTTQSWLAGLKRNAASYQDEESVVSAVNRGNVAAGIINQYYWYRLRLEVGTRGIDTRLYYFPDRNVGSTTNISGAAMLASSKKQALVQRFLAFVVSKAGQEIIADSDDFEYPARRGVAANAALPPLSSIAHTSLSVAVLGTDAVAQRLIQQAGLV